LPSVFNRLPVFFENLPVFGRKTGNGALGRTLLVRHKNKEQIGCSTSATPLPEGAALREIDDVIAELQQLRVFLVTEKEAVPLLSWLRD